MVASGRSGSLQWQPILSPRLPRLSPKPIGTPSPPSAHVLRDGCTPLYIAAQYGKEEALRRLLAAGADPTKRIPRGTAPLFAAAQNGHVAAVRLLYQAGAGVEVAAADGATPLFVATQLGLTDMVRPGPLPPWRNAWPGPCP